MRNIFLILFLVSPFTLVYAQTTFTVNTISMGVDNGPTNPGSLDVIIDYAVDEANLGNNVIVSLNVPDQGGGMALIPIVEAIIIDNNAGSIRITSGSGTVIQGIEAQFPGYWGSYGAEGFVIKYATNVTIDGLLFANFTDNPLTGFVSEAIITVYSKNVDVLGNDFKDNTCGLLCLTSDLKAEGNDFLDQEHGIAAFFTAWSSMPSYELLIENNQFHHTTPSYSSLTRNGIFVEFQVVSPNLSLNVQNNSFNAMSRAIRIHNDVHFGQNCGVEISSNTLVNSGSAIILYGPKHNWIVEGNIIDDVGIAINMTQTYHGIDPVFYPNDFGIDFVEANALLVPTANTGNVITNSFTSFLSDIQNKNLIIRYVVEGEIDVVDFYPTVVRENLISHDMNTGLVSPIDLLGGNNSFDAISLISANYSNPLIIINYTVNGSPMTNGQFVVEFFEASDDGDLISFIGNQTITANGAYSAAFSGVTFTTGDRIGATITSLGNVSGGIELGTSEVEYIEFTTIPLPCDTCNSFMPKVGEPYWISAWVQVETIGQVKTYLDGVNGPSLELGFFGSSSLPIVFYPTGEIIDGWQRIVGKFEIPAGTLDLFVTLNANLGLDTYFDDIRIHPFNASMKSYVYDGETFWLVSELDDNNYATFYEYDEEGGLIRIKKETARGVVTIQETRSSTIKD